MVEKIFKSKNWDNKKGFFSVIVPVYNRAKTVLRTIKSIENQTFNDFEIIIVDDGSTDDLDKVILPFVDKTNIPVLYIKKENGGAHTARNRGALASRGKLYVEIDSDDELTPKALEIFKDTWNSIPIAKKNAYREIVGLCKDENGKLCGTLFPKNINALTKEDAIKECIKTNGEHLSCLVTKIRQQYLFPEPEGVTFSNENILWAQLAKKYKSYFVNEIVRIYHTEGDDHLNTILNKTPQNKTLQQCKNGLWECWFMLNDWQTYSEYASYFPTLLRYTLMNQVLKSSGEEDFPKRYKLNGRRNLFFFHLFYLPIFIYSFIYKHQRMK